MEEGIFYSELVCLKEEEVIRIDSRTSDAVALALRFNCPIYTFEEIMVKAGIVLDLEDSKKEDVHKEKPASSSSILFDSKGVFFSVDAGFSL